MRGAAGNATRVLLLQPRMAGGRGARARNLLGLFFGTGVGAAFLQDGCRSAARLRAEIGSDAVSGLSGTWLAAGGLRVELP